MRSSRENGRTERLQSLMCGIIGIVAFFGGIVIGIFKFSHSNLDTAFGLLFSLGGAFAAAIGFGMYVYYHEPEVLKRLKGDKRRRENEKSD